MKRIAIVVALVILGTVPAQAAPKHYWKDKKVIVGEIIIVASTLGLDASSTCRAIHHRGVDTNLMVVHSCGAAIGMEAGAAAFYSLVNYASWKLEHDDPNKYWRFASYWTIPVAVCAIHCTAAAQNFDLDTPAARIIKERRRCLANNFAECGEK
jgi:hypothetical protein